MGYPFGVGAGDLRKVGQSSNGHDEKGDDLMQNRHHGHLGRPCQNENARNEGRTAATDTVQEQALLRIR